MSKTYTMSEIDTLFPKTLIAVSAIAEQLVTDINIVSTKTMHYDIDGHELKVIFSSNPMFSFAKATGRKFAPIQAALIIPGIPPYVMSLSTEELESGKIDQQGIVDATFRILRIIKLAAAHVMLRNIDLYSNVMKDLDTGNMDLISDRFKGMVTCAYNQYGFSLELWASSHGIALKEHSESDTLVLPVDYEKTTDKNKKILGRMLMDYIAEGFAFSGFYSDYKYEILQQGK